MYLWAVCKAFTCIKSQKLNQIFQTGPLRILGWSVRLPQHWAVYLGAEMFFLVLVLCFGEALAHLLQGLSRCCMALLWWLLISVPVAFLSCSLPVLLWPLRSTRYFHQKKTAAHWIFLFPFAENSIDSRAGRSQWIGNLWNPQTSPSSTAQATRPSSKSRFSLMLGFELQHVVFTTSTCMCI